MVPRLARLARRLLKLETDKRHEGARETDMGFILMAIAIVPVVLELVWSAQAERDARRPFVALTPAEDAALAAALRRGLARD